MTSNNIEDLAAEINTEVAEAGLDGVHIVKEYDDYVSGLAVEDAPDLDRLYEDTINQYARDYDMDVNEKQALEDEVYANQHTYDELKEQAFENYNDADGGDG